MVERWGQRATGGMDPSAATIYLLRMRTRRRPRHRTAPALFALVLPAFLLVPAHGAAQFEQEGVRFGVTLGATGFVGISFEFFEESRAIDLTVGTWGFQDVSVAVTAKELLGAADFRPSIGLGLWMMVGWDRSSNPDATRNGVTLLARAPIGFDWRLAGEHYLTADLSLNRALWIRRMDPSDDRPPNPRLVPFPGLAYRWKP